MRIRTAHRLPLVVALILATVAPCLGWTLEKWTEDDLSAEDAIRWKMMTIAAVYQDAELLELEIGADHEGSRARATAVASWLSDLTAAADRGSVDWAEAHEQLRSNLGEDVTKALLERVRIRGGRAHPPSGRAPSDYSISTMTYAWHQPVQHVTKVVVLGAIAVSAGPGAQVHGAIQVEREHYGEPACGDWYNGSTPACTAISSAFDGMLDVRSCTSSFVDTDCDDGGNVSTLVARLTFLERDEHGNLVTELLDDYAASNCAAASCACGVDHDY